MAFFEEGRPNKKNKMSSDMRSVSDPKITSTSSYCNTVHCRRKTKKNFHIMESTMNYVIQHKAEYKGRAKKLQLQKLC